MNIKQISKKTIILSSISVVAVIVLLLMVVLAFKSPKEEVSKNKISNESQVELALPKETDEDALENDKSEIPTRDKIKKEFTWDLTQIYKTDSDWQKDFDQLKDIISPRFADYTEQLGDKDKALECLRLVEQARTIEDRLYTYASAKKNQDLSNSINSERYSKAVALFSRVNELTTFIDPELLALPDEKLAEYMEDDDFADYTYLFKTLVREKSHILPKEQEELLSKTADMASSFSNIYTKLSGADIEFPVIKDSDNNDFQLSETRYSIILNSSDRDFRERAYKGLLGSFDQFSNTMSEILSGKIQKDLFYARARNFDSLLDYYLEADYVDQSILKNLLNSVNRSLPQFHKYISLRKKVLNVEKIRGYDLYAPLIPEMNKKITYTEAKANILDALTPLGNKYVADLVEVFDNRWIDVYETKDKRSGAYASSIYTVHPYILLNYGGLLYDMKSLAGELGYAMNYLYVSKAQPFAKADVDGFNSKIPSIINEHLLLKYLINNATTDSEKLYYLNSYVENIFINFFTQAIFTEFEITVHGRIENGDPLSEDILDGLWADLTSKYFGSDYEVIEESKATWTRISHFFKYNFSVYRYATGTAAANELSKRLINKEEGVLDNYLEYLTAGKSDFPLEILKRTGIDMNDNTIYDDLANDFGKAVEDMEILLKSQGLLQR